MSGRYGGRGGLTSGAGAPAVGVSRGREQMVVAGRGAWVAECGRRDDADLSWGFRVPWFGGLTRFLVGYPRAVAGCCGDVRVDAALLWGIA